MATLKRIWPEGAVNPMAPQQMSRGHPSSAKDLHRAGLRRPDDRAEGGERVEDIEDLRSGYDHPLRYLRAAPVAITARQRFFPRAAAQKSPAGPT